MNRESAVRGALSEVEPGAARQDRLASEAEQRRFRPRRRLGALEAAAAMAVIVACVAALASMTGLLPASLHFTSEQPVAATGQAPAALETSAPVAVAVPAASAPAAGMGDAQPPAAALPAVTATSAVTPPTPFPAATTDSPAVGTPAAPPAPIASNSQTRRPRGRAHRARDSARSDVASNHPGAVAHRTGKTREQVIAELLQSKRDGTYPAQSETYR